MAANELNATALARPQTTNKDPEIVDTHTHTQSAQWTIYKRNERLWLGWPGDQGPRSGAASRHIPTRLPFIGRTKMIVVLKYELDVGRRISAIRAQAEKNGGGGGGENEFAYLDSQT